jgi:adenylate cyclase
LPIRRRHRIVSALRYIKTTILIGLLVSLFVGGLFEAGVFRHLDQGLANFLGLRYSPVTPHWPQFLLLLIFAFGTAWTTIDVPRYSLKVVIALGTLAQVISGVWVLNMLGVFFSPFVSAFAVVLSFAAAFSYSLTDAGSRKRIIRGIFGDRISKRTFGTLLDTNVPLEFEGELHEATIVVCEIFNHDELTEHLPVADYVAINNAFLQNAADFLVDCGGYLDECDGESLRVVFGTPLPDARHAATACEAALGLATRLDAVNKECQRVWKRTFDFRIGINSGEMTVAAYGSRRLGSFSVAGEPVEWARRLCSANLFYGSRILVGSLAYQLAEDFVEVRPIELVQHHPEDRIREEVYELLARKSTLSDAQLAKRDAFWKGVLYYRKEDWDEALAHFAMTFSPETPDGPLEFYLRRIEQLRDGSQTLDWGGNRL